MDDMARREERTYVAQTLHSLGACLDPLKWTPFFSDYAKPVLQLRLIQSRTVCCV